jgi:hypothetical protein
MQATSDGAAPLQKQNSYSQAIEDLLHWPIRWWGSCETNQEENDPFVYHPELLGEGISCRQQTQSAALPTGPKDRTIARYVANQEETSLGKTLYGGVLLYVRSSEEIVEVSLSVHANAFSIVSEPRPYGGEDGEIKFAVETFAAFSFSPFSIVSPAQLAGYQGPSAQTWAPFKLTVVRAEGDRQYVFICIGKDAEDSRSNWIEAIAAGIQRVTGSLFPPYSMEVRPLPSVASTATRLLAGYLLRCETSDSVALLYGELHAYFGGEAKLALYKDEWCDQKVSCLTLTQNMDVHSCKGVDCSIFALDGHLYAARSQEERLIWLRALGNIKVKLLYVAPDPSREEIAGFRAAILERALDLKQIEVASQRPRPMLPLLPARPRIAPKSLRGDELSPEPLDDEMSATTQSRSSSRMVAPPLAVEEDDGACRLAMVVELMDVSECREFLRPFDGSSQSTSIDLDTLGDIDDVPILAAPSISLSLGEVDEVPAKAQEIRKAPHIAPPQLLTPRLAKQQQSGVAPKSDDSANVRFMVECVPGREEICRRRCNRDGGPEAKVPSYPDLLTLTEQSRDRESHFRFV